MNMYLLLFSMAASAGPTRAEIERHYTHGQRMIDVARPAPKEPVPTATGTLAALDEVGLFGCGVDGSGKPGGWPFREHALQGAYAGKGMTTYRLAGPLRHESGAILRDPGALEVAALGMRGDKVLQMAFLLEPADATAMVQWLQKRFGAPRLQDIPRMGVWNGNGGQVSLTVVPGTTTSIVQFVPQPGRTEFGVAQ